METKDKMVIDKHRKPDLTEINEVLTPDTKKFNPWSGALMWGVQAGVWMGAYLLLLQVVGLGDIVALKFAKYLFLLAFLGWALTKYRKVDVTNTFFPNGIKLGAVTTFFSAISLLIVNSVISLMVPEYSFSKFSMEINTPLDFFVTSGTLFFEVLVFGMVGTFIWLQYLKRKVDKNAVQK